MATEVDCERRAIQALRPTDFAPAFGRAEARWRVAITAGLKPRPFKTGLAEFANVSASIITSWCEVLLQGVVGEGGVEEGEGEVERVGGVGVKEDEGAGDDAEEEPQVEMGVAGWRERFV